MLGSISVVFIDLCRGHNLGYERGFAGNC